MSCGYILASFTNLLLGKRPPSAFIRVHPRPRLYRARMGVKQALHQIQPRRDDQTELPVRRPQGLFHVLRRGTTGEDETRVTRSLWEGAQFFGEFGGDGDIFNTGDTESPIESLNALQETSPRDREHHGPSGTLFTGQRGNLQATGVSNEQFGEGHPGPKA